MALRTIPPSREEEALLLSRFQTAASAPQPDDFEERVVVQNEVRTQIIELAQTLDVNLENSSAKEQALTHLEAALMWAGKAIFS